VRELVDKALDEGHDAISRADFVARVRTRAGDAGAAELVDVVDHGAEPKLAPDLAGRCYRLVRKPLVMFELGFTVTSGEEMTVESVKPGSRAEVAGLHAGDLVKDLRYEEGRSQVSVDMTILRGQQQKKLRFLPAGPSKPGRIFERVPGIPNEQC
jgi:predicted metalloprotease with PDZ domain